MNHARKDKGSPTPAMILFRPADGRRFKHFYQACELLELPREKRRMGLLGFKQHAGELVSTDFDFHPGPIDLRVRLRGSRWIQLLAPAAIPDAAEAALRCEMWEAIVIERDESKEQTSIRVASRGNSVMTFCATGQTNGTMKIQTFEAEPKYQSVVKKQNTIDGVQTALLRLTDAKLRHLIVERRDGVTVLRPADGRALSVKEVDEAYMVEYAVVSAAESPASVALQLAIDNADPAAVRKAIRQGANLQFLPGLMTSPLRWSLLKRKGDWLDCIKALLDAGAPVGVGPNQDPAIIVAVDVSGAKEESTIQLVDYLLKRGASIEARGNSTACIGMTPLHVAAREGLLGVVAHLLKRGADVHATLASGAKASDLPRPSHTFLGDEHRAVKELLLAVERGEIRPAVLKTKAIAQQADRLRNGVKDAIRDWAMATGSPIAAFFAAGETALNPKPKRSRR